MSLEPVRDGSIKFKFQRDSFLSELCAVKVFILECCETKQDRGGRGRPNPEKNMVHHYYTNTNTITNVVFDLRIWRRDPWILLQCYVGV